MSVSKGKPPSSGPSDVPVSIEEIFNGIEERVEGLSTRIRELSAENARLKGALLETAAERDRVKAEREDARRFEAGHAEVSDKLSRYESEREAVKGRIERLLKNLEEAEGAGDPAHD